MKKLVNWIWQYLKEICLESALFIAIFIWVGEDLGCRVLKWISGNNGESKLQL